MLRLRNCQQIKRALKQGGISRMSNESAAATQNNEHMPDYKRTLGFWDLFSIATGIIIGSGVLVFTGRGIAGTGRSICVAYLGAAVWVI